MAKKKYEMIMDDFRTTSNDKVYRIRSLIDFDDVKKGDFGGYINCEQNLSHVGNCWIYDEAMVFGNSKISGDAKIKGNAKVYMESTVKGHVRVQDNANVIGSSLSGTKCISGYEVIVR